MKEVHRKHMERMFAESCSMLASTHDAGLCMREVWSDRTLAAKKYAVYLTITANRSAFHLCDEKVHPDVSFLSATDTCRGRHERLRWEVLRVLDHHRVLGIDSLHSGYGLVGTSFVSSLIAW